MPDNYAVDDVMSLARDIGCGDKLTLDLMRYAGGDADLVREASMMCSGVDSLKSYIIDHRISRIERKEQ